MPNDEALMLAFQRGSREAFDELFARYRQLLYGYFRRRLASRERAEDLTQETFLALLRATERYEPRALFRTYLFGIAIKLLAAEHRKSMRAEMPGNPVCDPQADEALWVRQALAAPGAPRAGNPDAAGVRAAQLFGNRRADAPSAEYGADAAVPVPRGAQRAI